MKYIFSSLNINIPIEKKRKDNVEKRMPVLVINIYPTSDISSSVPTEKIDIIITAAIVIKIIDKIATMLLI